jgi:protein ImuA
MMSATSPISPENLPHVWRAPQLACVVDSVVSTGHPALDAQLPGGGWPCGNLVEILQGRAGRHAWQLLLPALAHATAEAAGPVVLVNPPHLPFGPALAAQGLTPDRLLRVHAARPQAALWASEQALRCADVLAVMAWLPRCRGPELRRLHLAAAPTAKLLFVFRGVDARSESSPARVRLEVGESEQLCVHLLKRRGPPLAHPLELATHPLRLQRLLESRRSSTTPAPSRSHGLDRTLAVA